jgi:cell division protein FtsW (lipid II flippase)
LREWWQIQQGLIAIWAWGFFCQWYWKGLQKMWQLPEAYSDMIFAAYSEEIGFFGNMILFALYIWMFILVLKRIPYIKDPQMKVLCVWIIYLIVVQVFVHVGVNVEVLPNTWLTLPFVSHWWTALLINLIELTLLYKLIETWKERDVREIKIDNE